MRGDSERRADGLKVPVEREAEVRNLRKLPEGNVGKE